MGTLLWQPGNTTTSSRTPHTSLGHSIEAMAEEECKRTVTLVTNDNVSVNMPFTWVKDSGFLAAQLDDEDGAFPVSHPPRIAPAL